MPTTERRALRDMRDECARESDVCRSKEARRRMMLRRAPGKSTCLLPRLRSIYDVCAKPDDVRHARAICRLRHDTRCRTTPRDRRDMPCRHYFFADVHALLAMPMFAYAGAAAADAALLAMPALRCLR